MNRPDVILGAVLALAIVAALMSAYFLGREQALSLVQRFFAFYD